MSDPIIGRRLFTDGSERDVFQAVDGRQYVLGDDGAPVFGGWLVDDEADASFVVPAER